MCDDIEDCRRKLAEAGVASSEVINQGWGLLSSFKLLGGDRSGFINRVRKGRPQRSLVHADRMSSTSRRSRDDRHGRYRRIPGLPCDIGKSGSPQAYCKIAGRRLSRLMVWPI
jgi:hypothetical protein